jgi:hypothetical protein
MTSSARPGERYGQFWRWILTEMGMAVGQPGSTDSVLFFERVPACSAVWVLVTSASAAAGCRAHRQPKKLDETAAHTCSQA